MASRDIWSRAGSLQVRDLLASLLSSRLLAEAADDPLYVCSPYLTDFPVFDNAFGQFQPLFRPHPDRPYLGERSVIMFSESLIELSSRMPVRLIGVPGEYASAFLRAAVRKDSPNISGRFASDLYHEKGLLCSSFYLEGSMNFTYSGVYRRDEKITAHTPDTEAGEQKIAAATLEFKRLWGTLSGSEIPRT
jgi:hypothetical protein